MGYLKGIIIFGSGALCGAGGMYLFMKSRYDKTINDQLAEIREEYYNKSALKQTEEIIKENKYIKSEEGEKEILVDRIEELAEKPESPSEDYPDCPIIIDEPDFSETELYFDKISVDYYLDDGALVDENDELINIDETIGFDNLDTFLKDDGLGVMYVRNASSGTDYEVNKLSGKYSEIIGLGGDDDED